MLVRDFDVAEAVNKKGLRRAKKDPQQLEQQDAHVAAFPFGSSSKVSFCFVSSCPFFFLFPFFFFSFPLVGPVCGV
jgi:hypothetical protein